MVKNRLSTIMRFVVSFGLLALLIWIMRKDAKGIANIIKDSNKALILSAVFLNAILTIAFSYRLKLLMSGQNIFLSIKDALYLTFIGYFFNNFLPTAIGGDIAKAHYASRKTNNKIASYAAVLTDRMLGMLATLLIALIGIIFIGKSLHNKFIVWAVPAVFILTSVIIAVLFRKNGPKENTGPKKSGLLHNLVSKILKLYTAVNLYRNNPALLIKSVALSLVLQAGAISGTYLFVLSVGGNMPFFKLFLIIPVVWAVSMLPSLNGLGVREGAFIYFLKGYIGPEKAFAVSLLWLGLIMLYSLVGGIYHIAYPSKKEFP